MGSHVESTQDLVNAGAGFVSDAFGGDVGVLVKRSTFALLCFISRALATMQGAFRA